MTRKMRYKLKSWSDFMEQLSILYSRDLLQVQCLPWLEWIKVFLELQQMENIARVLLKTLRIRPLKSMLLVLLRVGGIFVSR
jgi:hypothetical protein